jgi:hypothetical protein
MPKPAQNGTTWHERLIKTAMILSGNSISLTRAAERPLRDALTIPARSLSGGEDERLDKTSSETS